MQRWIFAVGLAGCMPEPREPGSAMEGGASIDPSSTSSGAPPEATGGSSLEDGSEPADGSSVKLDVGPDDPDAPEQTGCRNIDFLFVIDNSLSMASEHQNLVASFEGFVDAIESTVAASDFHVMVVDSDGVGGGSVECVEPNCCELYCSVGPGLVCNGVPCSDDWGPVGQCDAALGAGHIGAPEMPCPGHEEVRYITSDQPGLAGRFTCVANVGTGGSGSEAQVGAMLAAVSPLANAPSGCNAGFLRDDALLVVTMITDEDDAFDPNSGGEPEQWRAKLLAAKGGDASAVVVLGLLGDSDLAGGLCGPFDETTGVGAEGGVRLRTFIESLDNGLWASVCAPDYSPFFLEAVETIDVACDSFEPPG